MKSNELFFINTIDNFEEVVLHHGKPISKQFILVSCLGLINTIVT